MINNISEGNKDIHTGGDVGGEWEQSISRKCSCHNCNTNAKILLEVLYTPVSGYYCEHCSIDLKWHGIAIESEEVE